jgi:DNA (cytosine-5)-methyltransferase 1
MAAWAGYRVADIGCGVGISSDGYAGAGLHVTGFDINPEVGKHYPYEFRCLDMRELSAGYLAANFDLLHLGAPCQHWSKMTLCRPGLAEEYPDLITPMRPVLQASGLPYVIENVENSPLIDPVWLCGFMFRKELYRHRGFETGNGLTVPRLRHPKHVMKASRAGHWVPGTVMSVAGHAAPIWKVREVMGVERYVPREMLKEAAPAYMTAYVAAHAMAYLSREAALWLTRSRTGKWCCPRFSAAAGR